MLLNEFGCVGIVEEFIMEATESDRFVAEEECTELRLDLNESRS